MKKLILSFLVLIVGLGTYCQTPVQVVTIPGTKYVYVGSLVYEQSSGGNSQKIVVKVLGGSFFADSNGETTFYISNREGLSVKQISLGSYSSSRIGLKAYQNGPNIDFYIVPNPYDYTSFAVSAFSFGNGIGNNVINVTVQSTEPTGTDLGSALKVTPIMMTDEAGNVGLGTASPKQMLTVNGNINLENATGGNYLGFGTAGLSEYNTLGSMYSSAGLVLAHGLKPSATVAGLVYSYPDMSRNAIVLGDHFSSGGIKFFTKPASHETVDLPFVADPAMQLTDQGNLLIGKTSQANAAYLLDVNGKARLNELVVNTTGADFVFEPDYKLSDLPALEKFVKINKHLPEIPTAKQMVKEGVNLGELNIKLLQKVEELTLHLIEKDKQIQEDRKLIKMQDHKLEKLQANQKQFEALLKKIIKNK